MTTTENITIILLDNTAIPDRKVYNTLSKNIQGNDEIVVIDITGKEYLVHKNMIYWQETLDKINNAVSDSKNDKILLLNHLSDISSDCFDPLKQIIIKNDVCLYHKNNDNKFSFKDNVMMSFDKKIFLSVGGFTERRHYIKNFCHKINNNKIKHIVYPKDILLLPEKTIYENISVVGFFKKNSLYHDKLKKFFNEKNIHVVSLGDKDCYTKMLNFISKTKNDNIILLSMCDTVFNDDVFIDLNENWKNNALNILSDVNIKKYTWSKKIDKISVGFNKNFINIPGIQTLSISLFRKYLLNLYKNNVVKITTEDFTDNWHKFFPVEKNYNKEKISHNSTNRHKPVLKKKIIKKTPLDIHNTNNIFEYANIKDNKIIRTGNKFQRIEVRNDIKMIKYKPCVCMCLYSRPENLEKILNALSEQTYKNFEFFIWNNKPEIKRWVNEIIQKYKDMNINVYHSDSNKGSYARLLIPYKTKNNPIIYFDDDRIPQKDFVEYCLKRYVKFPFAIQSSWAFQIRNDYWKRTKIERADIEVDYCGTGGMVLDRSLFNDNRVVDIPDEYKNIEDLWLNFIARRYHDKPLISMENRLTILKDGKDQFTKLASRKTELFNYIRKKGYKLVSDIDKHPKISIIVVSYNRWEMTKKCIDSIVNNTPIGTYKLIIVDNNSDNSVIQKLKDYKQKGYIHKLILNNKNGQLGQGFNTGYKNCSKDTDYIMTLNNDHFVMNGWYYNVISAFKNKDIGFVASLIRGRSFHLKKEIIDKETNCRFMVMNGDINRRLFPREIKNGMEIGEGLVFRSNIVFKNKIKWYEGFPSEYWKGSYHAKIMTDYLWPLKLKGIEIGRPCVLTQKNDMDKYNDYYRKLFDSRGKKLPKQDYHFDVIQDKQEYYRWTDYLKEI